MWSLISSHAGALEIGRYGAKQPTTERPGLRAVKTCADPACARHFLMSSFYERAQLLERASADQARILTALRSRDGNLLSPSRLARLRRD
jgi:hypothetical protein